MYRYLLFDLDGTLTDPEEGITKCVQYALRHFGIDVPAESLKCFIGPPLLEQFMEYAHFTREQAEEALRQYRVRFSDVGIFENRVLDGVPAMLAALREDGRVLAVASSKPTVYVERILEKFGLRDFFTVVVGSELDGRRTKKKDVIEEVLVQLSYTGDRRDVLMIGDREHDILGAKACSIAAMGVRFGFASEGELEAAGADLIADTPAHVVTLIRSADIIE